jgi:hypothetical protein
MLVCMAVVRTAFSYVTGSLPSISTRSPLPMAFWLLTGLPKETAVSYVFFDGYLIRVAR